MDAEKKKAQPVRKQTKTQEELPAPPEKT